ncbi:MAG: hypothetical protein KatS3mg076_0842 [Candidatus Binatia bacterium]|nr:MAG: hypothetical protein KatS3mg076_0842 [Candidatus Binatia bacterium]
MDVRAVFFDAVGTLFDLAQPVGTVYAREASRFGVVADPEDLERKFRKSFREAPPLAFPGASERELDRLERDWWKNLVRRVFRDHEFPRFEKFFAELYEGFATPRWWKVHPRTNPTLRTLRSHGLVLGIVSNFDHRLERLLEALDLRRYFDSVVVSSRAGFAKPDPRIFRLALRSHGIRPAQALHVGDSPEEDLAGARAAGLHGLLVDPLEGPAGAVAFLGLLLPRLS